MEERIVFISWLIFHVITVNALPLLWKKQESHTRSIVVIYSGCRFLGMYFFYIVPLYGNMAYIYFGVFLLILSISILIGIFVRSRKLCRH